VHVRKWPLPCSLFVLSPLLYKKPAGVRLNDNDHEGPLNDNDHEGQLNDNDHEGQLNDNDHVQKNDAEAVLVRDGCIFVGYDHEKGIQLKTQINRTTFILVGLLLWAETILVQRQQVRGKF
jgi:hypothetical protein